MMPGRAPAAPAAPSRESYIASRLPIEGYLRQLFPKLDARIVFDIGSCEGEDAIRYSNLFPRATIYAFEPLPDNVRLLRDNVERWSKTNIEVREVALSDEAGHGSLHVSSGRPPGAPASDWDYGNKSSSLLPPDRHLEVHPWVSFDRTIDVQTDTIARIAEAEGLDRIDFVHLDVQGAELRVLTGAGPYLDRIGAVWMEVEAIPLYAGQPLKGDVERFMAAHGFERVASTVDSVSGDQLYVNPRLLRMPHSQFAGPDRARLVKAARGILRWIPGLRRAVRATRRLANDAIRRPIRERRAIQRWRRSAIPLPPPAALKRATVRSYARRFGLTTLVETGTYHGDMVEAQRRRFAKVVSIELSHELHVAARRRFAQAGNVELLEGDSGEILPSVLERLDRPALFWLDGHYSAGVTARGALETPVRSELEAILSSPRDHCILVDDARCFGTGDYPTIEDVVALVQRKRPGWSCAVQDDIIRIHPARP